MSEELWKFVPDHPMYMVSNTGKVLSLYRDRIMLPQKVSSYMYVKLDNIPYRVHRLVAESWCERKDGCTIVNHINENKLDNKAENLEWVTARQNAIHSLSSKKNTKYQYHSTR